MSVNNAHYRGFLTGVSRNNLLVNNYVDIPKYIIPSVILSRHRHTEFYFNLNPLFQ
jgi:hypothetical protein